MFRDDLRATVVFSRLDMPMSEKKNNIHIINVYLSNGWWSIQDRFILPTTNSESCHEKKGLNRFRC